MGKIIPIKKLMFLPLFFLIGLLPYHSYADTAAPDFTLPLLDNTHTLTLSDFKGQWVYLDFWASWCGPCRKSFPWMNQLLASAPKGSLHIIAVGVDQQQSDASKFVADHPVNFDVVWDGNGHTPATYGVKAMPSSYLIDPSGQVRLVHLGFREAEKSTLQKNILMLVSGEKQ